ncbi:MAG: GMC family oxidoreductase, partial [Rhodobacteraceae bacterium]|nr:GMC family oxidoreductase [Paracoccaceae bacterium]
VSARIGGRDLSFFAPLGAGLGGSSAFYAATLERPEPHDLDHSAARPHPTGGWPVAYSEMQPFLDQAEALYHVGGQPDPLSDIATPNLAPGPEISSGDAALMAALRANGMHPYQLHGAIRNLPGCLSCLGHKCPRACKMDGRSAGVEPALATGNATLLDNAEVTAIYGRDRVSHIEVMRDGEVHNLTARSFVLAGGALGSARLLLASRDEDWPDGFANHSGQVGRNLMFHLNEMLAVWTKRKDSFDGPSKAVSFRDLYYHQGQRFGTVQAMGIDASYGEILHYLRLMIARSPTLSRLPGANDLARLPAMVAARMFGSAKVFVGLIEDLPYADNRVIYDAKNPRRISFNYDFAPELLARRRAFRRAVRHAFRGQRRMFLGQQPEPNIGHPSGTLRMGNDPSDSVVDANCRAHGVANLYVADSGVFPTSLGVNPSLTIAANALRVAGHMAKGISHD